MQTSYDFVPQGVCSRMIHVELDDDIISSVTFTGGCDGNLRAIAKLIQGKSAHEIIPILEGNTCGRKSTSCADQLTKALHEALD